MITRKYHDTIRSYPIMVSGNEPLTTTKIELGLHLPYGVQVWVQSHILQNLMNFVRPPLQRQVQGGLVRFGGHYIFYNNISRIREKGGVHTGKRCRRVQHPQHFYRQDPREYLCQ